MALKKYYHKKLIRDKVPKIMKLNGDEYELGLLKSGEFEKELKKKLVEEAKEAQTASKKDLVGELADILELIKSISSHYKIPFSKVEKIRKEKNIKKGGFKKRLFLIWSTGKAGK